MFATVTTLFLIEFRQSQAKHIYAKKNIVGDHEPVYRPGQIGSEGATYSAYLVAKSAPEVCPTFDMLKSQSKSVTANTTHSPKRPSSLQFATHNVRPEQRIASTSSYAPQGPPSTSSLSKEVSTFSQGQTSRSERVPAERGSSPDIVELEEAPPLTMREKMLRAAQARMASSSSSPVKPDVKGKGVATAQPDLLQPAAVPSLRNPLFNARSDIQMTATCDGHFVPDIDAIRCSTWEPGSYTIQLIIDSREKPGLNSRRVEKMLTDKGIAWESATLAMGDAIWIARHKETGNEVVLDASLERKRLDDLLSSMRGKFPLNDTDQTTLDLFLSDGRYMEQKNRMVQSGMSRLVSSSNVKKGSDPI